MYNCSTLKPGDKIILKTMKEFLRDCPDASQMPEELLQSVAEYAGSIQAVAVAPAGNGYVKIKNALSEDENGIDTIPSELVLSKYYIKAPSEEETHSAYRLLRGLLVEHSDEFSSCTMDRIVDFIEYVCGVDYEAYEEFEKAKASEDAKGIWEAAIKSVEGQLAGTYMGYGHAVSFKDGVLTVVFASDEATAIRSLKRKIGWLSYIVGKAAGGHVEVKIVEEEDA